MKLDSIKNNFSIHFKALTALHVFMLSDDVIRAEWVQLQKERGKVVTKQKETFSGSFNEFLKSFSSEYPIALSLDGKGVLVKKWEHAGESPKAIFRELFPQAQFQEFYMQLHTVPNQLWVSVSRKAFIQKLLISLNHVGGPVIDLKFGPFHLEFVFTLTENADTNWILPNYDINWAEKTIHNYAVKETKNEFLIEIGTDRISSHNLLSFSHGLLLLANTQNLNNDIDEVLAQREEYRYKILIQKAGWSILVFFFVLLILNYLVFSSYNNKLNATQALYQSNLKTISRLENLTALLKQKEALAIKVGASSRQQFSYIADRLAATVPSFITLTSLNLTPATTKTRYNDTPEFDKGKIIISGTISNSFRLYSWIEQLKKTTWINSIEVINLEQESVEKQAVFTLSIQYSYHLIDKQ